ncbi:MAG: DinB family protein, partial [Pseudomonadales bacterium]
VDWYYISALEGHSVGPGAFEPEIPFPEFDTFEPEQRAADQRLIAVCEDLDEKALSKTIEMVRANRIQEDRVDRTLLHLFGHQIHHRDQIHAMLSGTDVAPPQLDEFFLGDAVEQNFRAADFTALGFDEALIWRDL